MEIKFKKIRIRNFRGLVSFDANLEGRSVRISGANGLGKSSVADAITWVLFGKDSRRRTAFPIDPVDDEGRIIHNLDVSVELEMLIDGQPTTLRRRRQEKWVQKRGMTTEQLDGHQTTCYIDGRPLPSSDFSSHVDTIVKEELFRALTTPDYFPSLPMDQQYRLLVKIVGTRTLAEIAAKDEEALKVVDELGQRSLDQYRQGLSYDLQRTRKELELIPVRLSEVQGFIEQVKAKGADHVTARKQAKEIEWKIDQTTQEIDSLAGVVRAENARYNEQRAHIQQLRQQLAAVEDRVEKQNRETRTLHHSLISKAKEDVEVLEERHTAATTLLACHERNRKNLDQQLEDFRRRWEDTERLTFSWPVEESICPTCGQPLPQDQADKKRAEAEARFNERKMQQQDALDEEGKKLAASKQRLQDLSAAAREEMATAERLMPEARERLSKAEAEPIEQADYHDAADWQRLSSEIDQRMKELEQTTQAQEPPQLAALRTEEQAYRKELRLLEQTIDRSKQIDEYVRREKELQKQRTTLSGDIARMQTRLEAAERLQLMEANDLQKRVNELFPSVRFRLSRELLNGREVGHCELSVDGVPYSGLSTSERINAGLELINALARHYNIVAPIVIDNAEAVNKVAPTLGQQILLEVSPAKKLNVEQITPSSLFE
jgi:DNA repair exonuclease SbcCD ATPase subunit